MRIHVKLLLSLIVVATFAAPLPQKPAQATTTARYVILFQGDGMGAEHVKAGGMYANLYNSQLGSE